METREFEVKTRKRDYVEKNYGISQYDYMSIIEKNGIISENTRHHMTFLLAVKLQKHDGYSREDAEKFLLDWHQNKNDDSLYDTSEYKIKKEIKNITRYVQNNKKYSLSKSNYITFSKAELEEIMSIENTKLRNVYFVLFCHAKSLSMSQKFFMTYEMMAQNGLTKNRQRLKGYLLRLEKLGKVVIEADGVKNVANIYSLPALKSVKVDKELMYKLNIEEFSDEILNCVAKKVFLDKELRKFYKKDQMTKIKKLNIEDIKIEEFTGDIEVDGIIVNKLAQLPEPKMRAIYLSLILNSICQESIEKQAYFDINSVMQFSKGTKQEAIEIIKKLTRLGYIRLKYLKDYLIYSLPEFQRFKIDVNNGSKRKYLLNL